MKIAITYWTNHRVGGAEAYMESMMQGMFERGYEIAFFHETDDGSSIPIIRIPDGCQSFGPFKNDIASSVQQLKDWQPDIILSNRLINIKLEEAIRKLAPTIYITHNYVGMCISGSKTHTRPSPKPCSLKFGASCLAHYFPKGCGGRSPLTAWNSYQLQRRWSKILLSSDHILTYSKHMRDQWILHGYPADQISCFSPYPPKDSTKDFPIPNHLPDLNDSNQPVRLLFAGRLELVKGGQFLIEAASLIQEKLNRKVEVVIAGDGPNFEKLKKQALNVEQQQQGAIRFEFPGWLSSGNLWEAMDASHLLVFPSIWPEPFGLLGIEAGLRRLPVIGYPVGGVPDWLRPGVNGYFAENLDDPVNSLAEAACRCFSSPEEHQRLRDGAAEVAAEFTAEKHLNSLDALFRSIG